MPLLSIFNTPPLKMQHQFYANSIQKVTKSLTQMMTPFSETTALAMLDKKRIHEEALVGIVLGRVDELKKLYWAATC